MSKLSEFPLYGSLTPLPPKSDVKIAATWNNQNINLLGTDLGEPAVNTFDPTSEAPVSGIALNFITKESDTLSFTFKDGTDEKLKLSVTQTERGSGATAEKINTLSVKSTSGEETTDIATVALEDMQNLSEFGYLQEAGTQSDGTGAKNYVRDVLDAYLSTREPSTITDSAEVEKVRTGQRVLREDEIVIFNATGIPLDLKAVACKHLATAEIWINVTDASTQIEWPAPEGGKVTWLELSQPTTLSAGTRHVIVIRNDSIQGGITHYAMNLAYTESLADLNA